ncbi:hypothetical protein D1AOALGA4SA_10877 [Olavius algarvensis Delta 1 endosymbiont]|nr:hypothetical protein D1AOALGA4SA_10877 [Olavius algarvensis Delta 1 endosymbiont]
MFLMRMGCIQRNCEKIFTIIVALISQIDKVNQSENQLTNPITL